MGNKGARKQGKGATKREVSERGTHIKKKTAATEETSKVERIIKRGKMGRRKRGKVHEKKP